MGEHVQAKAKMLGPVSAGWKAFRHDAGRFGRSLGRLFRMRWSTLLVLGLVLFGALALRLPAMDRGTQIGFSELYVDEYKILSNTMKVFKGKPLLAHWPYGLYRWLQPQFAVAFVASLPALIEAKGGLPGIGDAGKVYRDTRWFIGLLRYNALFFGLGLVVVVFGLTRHVAGDYPAISAAALAAASPVLVAYSRTLYYDLPMTFWFWVTVGVLAWTTRNRSLVGVYAGAALLAWTVTTKQNAITLAPLWAFVAGYVLTQREAVPWYRSLFSIHMVFAGILGLIIFFVNYPTLLNPVSWQQLGFLSGKEHLALAQDVAKPRLWEAWLTKYWPGQAHPAVLAVLASGLILLPIYSRDRTTAILISAATFLYYVIAGGMAHLNLRTIMPMVPGLCVGMAGWWLLAQRYLTSRRATTVATALTVLAMASLLSNSVRQTVLIALPNTAEQAERWMEEHVAPMTKVARETYTPRLVDAVPNSLFQRYAAQRGIVAFEVHAMGSLGINPPDYYRNEGIKYLIVHQRNLDNMNRDLKKGREVADYDLKASRIGKTARYGAVPLSEVRKNYEAIDREFKPVARFSANPPPNVDFVKTSYPWWTIESFIHPGLWNLRRNFDRYSLGEKVTIYQVR
jgi:hypothetical protein